MNPLSIGLGIAGLGLEAFGGFNMARISRQESQLSMDEAQQEMAINRQKNLQQHLETQRQFLQTYRTARRQLSLSTAAATAGGAQFGSGVQGAKANVTNTGVNTELGIGQANTIGDTIFGLTNKISQDKIQMASLQGQSASYQGIMSLGGSFLGAMGGFGRGI